MTQKVRVETSCDLDGDPGAVTVAFEAGGRLHEIDLCPAHKAPWDEVVSSLLPASRPLPSAAGGRPRRALAALNSDIRRWGREHGFPVSRGGPVPHRVLTAWADAHVRAPAP